MTIRCNEFWRIIVRAGLLLVLVACGPFRTIAQEYNLQVKYFGIEDGLSHREVNGLSIDQQGFYWIGTRHGMNRFDGYEFKVWSQETGRIDRNYVWAQVLDGAGELWVKYIDNSPVDEDEHSSYRLIDTWTGKARTLQERFGNDLPSAMYELNGFPLADGQGNLYFSTRIGALVRYSPDAGFSVWPLAPDQPLELLGVSGRGESWIKLGEDTLLRMSPEGQLTGRWENQPASGAELTIVDSTGTPWIFHSGNLVTRLVGGDIHETLSLAEAFQDFPGAKDAKVARVKYDPVSHAIWLNLTSDIVYGKLGQSVWISFRESYPEIPEARFRRFASDRFGRVLIGTDFGFYLVGISASRFTRYLWTPGKRTAYSVRGIECSGDTLFLSTYDGLVILNSRTGRPVAPTLQLEPRDVWFASALLRDRKGALWTGGQALQKVDPSNKVRFVAPFSHEFAPQGAWALYEDVTGRIWVGTLHGIGYWSAGQDSVRFYHPPPEFARLAESHVLGFVAESEREFWVCCSSGLYLMDIEKGVQARYWTGGQGEYYLPADDIQHLCRDKEGIYWLGTAWKGLIRWDRSRGELRQFTTRDGLSNNNIYAVYQGRHGNLWLSSDYGVIQFDPVDFYSRSFLPKDGVSHEEFNRIAHRRLPDGRILFGSLNGATAIEPDGFIDFEKDFKAPPIVVTEYTKLDGQTGQLEDLTSELGRQKRIVIRPSDRFISLKFVLLDPMESDRIAYSYRLDDQTEAWTPISGNVLRFSGLPYGKYLLRIRAQAADGRFVPDEWQMPIIVSRPFYLQSWFWLIVLAALAASMFGFLRLRTTQLRQRQRRLEATVRERTQTIERQAEQLRRLDEARSRFFANLSHDLRTPLALIMAPISSLLGSVRLEEGERRLAQSVWRNARHLQDLIDELLELSQHDAAFPREEAEPVYLAELLGTLITQFEPFAHERGVQLQLVTVIPSEQSFLLDAEKLDRILRNLLTNALKHTDRGDWVSLRASDEQGELLIGVVDSGSGIDPDDLPHVFERYFQSKKVGERPEGKGIGLALSQELAEVLGGRLWVESKLGQGSAFFLSLPMRKSKAAPERRLSDQPEQIPVGDSPGSGLILVVEDHPEMREYLETLLGEGHRTVSVGDGAEALQWLEKNQPDLIVSDYMMPVVDGLALLERLKSDDRWWSIPVIMLTARADLRDKLKALRIGVDDYLVKPFSAAELVARVNNLLRGRLQRLSPELRQNGGMSQTDAQWLAQLEAVVQEEQSNEQFSVSELAYRLAMSERHLQRRIRELTGLSPVMYIRQVRLQKARVLLETREYQTVAEVSFAVGFATPAYFSKLYKDAFGKSPSDYL